MEMIAVTDRRLRAIGYDAASACMQVEFPNAKHPELRGAVYRYEGVPPEIHAGLMAASEKGAYFQAEIVRDRKAPRFPYAKIAEPETPDASRPAPAKATPPAAAPPAKPAHQTPPPPEAVDAQVHAELAATPKGEILAPEGPLPREYDALLARVQTVPDRVKGLIRGEGVKVELVIQTADGYEQTAELFRRLTAEKREAEKIVEEEKTKLYEPYKQALERAKQVMGYYAVLDALDKAMTRYRQDEAIRRREAERLHNEQEQAKLNAQAAQQSEANAQRAEREAKALEAAGQPLAAEQVRSTPIPITAPTAAPVVLASEVPKTPGLSGRANWKNRIDSPGDVPLYFRDRFRQMIADAVAAAKGAALDDAQMGALTIKLAGAFQEIYSLDQVKINGILKPKKELGIGHIPGVTVWNDEKTVART